MLKIEETQKSKELIRKEAMEQRVKESSRFVRKARGRKKIRVLIKKTKDVES